MRIRKPRNRLQLVYRFTREYTVDCGDQHFLTQYREAVPRNAPWTLPAAMRENLTSALAW
jgi:hypothetical protein